jgi:hypothetical protein
MPLRTEQKFWEELFNYFPFTIICVFHKSRKKIAVCTGNEVSNLSVVLLLMAVTYELRLEMNVT